MIDLDILPFGRFNYAKPFNGSYKGMRFRITHPKAEEGEPDVFTVDVWPEPNCYEKTDENLIIKKTFDFSEDAYNKILEYLSDMYESRKWD